MKPSTMRQTNHGAGAIQIGMKLIAPTPNDTKAAKARTCPARLMIAGVSKVPAHMPA